MNNMIVWLLIGGGMFLFAMLWVAYLIKIVVNDEELQERIRQIRRQREEQRRALEDKIRKRRKQQEEMREGVEDKIQEAGAGLAAMLGGDQATEA